MSTTSHPKIPLWVQNRIVGFFNNARNVSMVLDGTIQDNPENGKGSTIGAVLAARILREKNNLAQRRFTDLEQIDAIRGVGKGMIEDFVYSFSKTADDTFIKNMYESGTIFQNNWDLQSFRYVINDNDEFTALTSDTAKLRSFIAEKIKEEASKKEIEQSKQEKMISEVTNAYIDSYEGSVNLASIAFALWFFKFDEDNWFSWDEILKQTSAYFDFNSNTFPWRIDLHLFKGFINRGIIEEGISADDLPVVVNQSEQSISFWLSSLFD